MCGQGCAGTPFSQPDLRVRRQVSPPLVSRAPSTAGRHHAHHTHHRRTCPRQAASGLGGSKPSPRPFTTGSTIHVLQRQVAAAMYRPASTAGVCCVLPDYIARRPRGTACLCLQAVAAVHEAPAVPRPCPARCTGRTGHVSERVFQNGKRS